MLALIATILGYFVMYWWVFGGFEKVLDVSVLKSQIVAKQKSDEVKTQLLDLGYEFEDQDFYQLNHPNNVNYHADVLGGYEPIKTDDIPQEESFYFHDENGQTFFFVVDENNEIDPDSFTSLISE